jgi:ABC-2 type transport system permease protein
VKRVGYLVFTIGVPLTLFIVTLLSSSSNINVGAVLERIFVPDQQMGQVGVVDQDGRFSPLLPDYAEDFKLFGTSEEGRSALKSDVIDALLIIPTTYGASDPTVTVVTTENASVTDMEPIADLLEPFFVDHLLRDEVVSEDLRTLIIDPYDLNRASLEDSADSIGIDAAQQVADAMVPYFAGTMLIMTIFLTSGYLLQGVANDKSSRIVEILLSSVSARDLLAGKVFGLAALGLTQISVWITSVILIGYGFSARAGFADIIISAFFTRPDFLILALVYYLLGFLVFAALYGAAGAVGTSQQEAQQLAGVFSLIAASPLFIAGVLFTNPNGILPRVMSYIPFTAPTMMLIRLPLTNVPTIDIIMSILLLVLTIPLMIWIGARLFRLGLLMYSQRPTIKQMLRSLRQA